MAALLGARCRTWAHICLPLWKGAGQAGVAAGGADRGGVAVLAVGMSVLSRSW